MGKQRDNMDSKGEKHRGADIEIKDCPECKHGRMWVSRGESSPTYTYKCTRCGHRI